MKTPSSPSPVTVEKEENCYICGKPKDEPGEMYCSYPHQRVPVAPADPDHPEGFWTWGKKDAVSATTVQGQMELLPCPWCNTTPDSVGILAHEDGNVYACRALDCPASGTPVKRERWNKRVALSSPKATESADAGSVSNPKDLRSKIAGIVGKRLRMLAKDLGGEAQSVLLMEAEAIEQVIKQFPAPVASVKHTKEADSGLKEAASDNVTAVLKMALNALLRYAGWQHNYRPDGTELPMTRPADVQEVQQLCQVILSEHGGQPDSASGASSLNPSAPASVEHVEQEKEKTLEEKEA